MDCEVNFYCRYILNPDADEVLEREFFVKGFDTPNDTKHIPLSMWVDYSMQDHDEVVFRMLRDAVATEDGAIYEVVFEAEICGESDYWGEYDEEFTPDHSTFKWKLIPEAVAKELFTDEREGGGDE